MDKPSITFHEATLSDLGEMRKIVVERGETDEGIRKGFGVLIPGSGSVGHPNHVIEIARMGGKLIGFVSLHDSNYWVEVDGVGILREYRAQFHGAMIRETIRLAEEKFPRKKMFASISDHPLRGGQKNKTEMIIARTRARKARIKLFERYGFKVRRTKPWQMLRAPPKINKPR